MATVAERIDTAVTRVTTDIGREISNFDNIEAILEQVTAKSPAHVIDHTAHQHERDCSHPGKWTWHTQNGGHIGTTNPNVIFASDNVTVYRVKAASTPAFTWGTFNCVDDETTRYRKTLQH